MGKKSKSSKRAERTERSEEIELNELNIIQQIPEGTVAPEVTAKIIMDDELVSVTKKLGIQEITRARQDFPDNVEDGDDYDVRYVLTDKGRAYLDQLLGSYDDDGE